MIEKEKGSENIHTGGEVIMILAKDEMVGCRLDFFLSCEIKDMSRSRLKSLIVDGYLSMHDIPLRRPAHKVSLGEQYRLIIPEVIPALPQGQEIPLNIIYEDEEIIVIDKPAGLVVHPAPGNPDNTLVNAFIAHCGNSLTGIGGVRRPGIVHRLDKDTSGVMVAAKSALAHSSLSMQFAERTVDRAYRALAFGCIKSSSGNIETMIGRSPRNRKKMAVVNRNGKLAITHYEMERLIGPVNTPLASLLICRLSTGRTHQIRVHLTHMGHPIIGDPVYGRAHKKNSKKHKNNKYRLVSEEARRLMSSFSRQALHAYYLGFEHPKTKKRLFFETILPSDMKSLINNLDLIE
jgi:23S rRNA pseudouridine1911/1915/1917 synthase